MQLNVFYSEIIETFLILRQLFSGERFKPFNQIMENLLSGLSEEDLKEIDDLGILSNGYLSALSHLISLYRTGPIDEISLLSQLLDDLTPLWKKERDTVNDERVQERFDDVLASFDRSSRVVKKIWTDSVCRERGNQSRRLYSELEKLKELKEPVEMLEYLKDISQRFTMDSEKIHFHIKPPLEREISQIDKILIMPSLFASRKLTFWYEGNTLLFLLSLQSDANELSGPSDMHLLYTSALNDKTRLKMLKLIAANNCTAGDLAKKLDLNASTVSRHLKLFKDSGFIDISSNDGRQIVYRINRLGIRKAFEELDQYINS